MTEFLFVFFGGLCLLAAGFGGGFFYYLLKKWDRKAGLKKIGPASDSGLRDWTAEHGYVYAERDDAVLEMTTRPRFEWITASRGPTES